MHDAIIVGAGMIGGKAAGYFRAKEHVERLDVRSGAPNPSKLIRFPETCCIATDVFDGFVERNKLAPLIHTHKWNEETAYESLKGHFLYGTFSEEVLSGLRNILAKMRYPLAVRSSSMLEDRPGTSFAGKYDTIFISNRGTDEARLEGLCRAIKEVYASTYNPSALQYRKKHGMLDESEHMAILLQQAVGREYRGYFLPLMAGVGFSQNGFCWTKEIRKSDGIVRLVFGLGTRAVGRGYARIFSPGRPSSRPEGMDAEAITRFSQGLVDALDLRDNVLKHIRFGEIVTDGFDCYPFAQRIFSLKDENYLYTPPTNFWHKSHKPVITFDGVLASPWLGLDLPRTAAWIFSELEACFNAPVDIEFAVRVDDDPDEAHFYLLQCRPLSQREEMKPLSVPAVPDGRKIIFIPRQVPTAHLPGIEYIISVDPLKYKNWPASDKFAVARVIGKLNQTLEGKTFILIGPGRWGSGNPELGVSVKYSEIANTKMLVEVSIKEADYLPEVSYGTHFFQDLIEDRIIYVPIFPDEEDAFINTRFLSDGSVFGKILTDEYYARYGEVVSVIHVPSVAGGRLAEAVFDGHVDEGVVFVR